MPDLLIRPVQLTDLEQYRALRLRSLQNEPLAFLAVYEDEVQLTEDKWRARLESSVTGEAGVTLVVEFEQQLVGMVGVTFGQKKKIAHVAHIWGTYLDRAHRGHGNGRRLMEAIIIVAKEKAGIRKIKIEVVPEQVSARILYEKLGFVQIGLGKEALFVNGAYYDEVLMEMYV